MPGVFGIDGAPNGLFARIEFDSRPGWELQNLLTIARLMIDAAWQREESRGVHYRSDFPHPDDAHWLRHLDGPPLAELFRPTRTETRP